MQCWLSKAFSMMIVAYISNHNGYECREIPTINFIFEQGIAIVSSYIPIKANAHHQLSQP